MEATTQEAMVEGCYTLLVNYTVECQIKYATCNLLGGALTWWNSQVRTVGHDAAYGMPWKTLMKMMTKNYCPRREIKKLETELWNLVVKDVFKKVKRYAGGLPDSIQGSVMASKPTKLQEAIELARKNHAHPPYKRQNVARAYTVGPGEKREYVGTLPLYNKCKFHHNGSWAAKNQGHYHSECPKLKNQNYGIQTGNGEAYERAYALGGGETDEDPNNIADDIDA
ncbi:reverse transcriptase domain-containing protein [Tanacetum coccineum]